MKKLTLLAALFGFAVAAHAQAPGGLPFSAVGYDDNFKHITARLPMGENALDLGLGFKFDNAAAEPFSMSVSGLYLIKTNTWGIVSNYAAIGGLFSVIDSPSDNIGIAAVAGFQPEITLLEHLIVSIRFGL